MPASASAVRAGKVVVELGVNDQFTSALKSIQKRMKAMGAAVAKVGAGMAAAGVAGLAAFTKATLTFVSVGDAMEEMSQRTSISTEALSELELAASLTGASLGDVEKASRKIAKTVTEAGQGSKTAQKSLARLGLTAEQLRSLSPEDQFTLIADRLSKVSNAGQRAAMAMELFGKSGTRLLPMISGGAAGLAEFRNQAKRLGLTIETDVAARAGKLADVLDTAQLVLRAMQVHIGDALAPTLTRLGNKLLIVGGAINNWIQQNKPLVLQIAKIAAIVALAGGALVALGTSLIVAGLAAGAIASAFGVVVAIGKALAASFLFMISPLGLTIGLLAAGGAAFLAFTETGNNAMSALVDGFKKLRNFLGTTIGAMSDALAAGDLSLAAKVLWASLKVAWETGTLALETIWAKSLEKILGFFVDLKFGILSLWNTMLDAMEPAIHETVGWVARQFIKLQAKLQGWSDQMLQDALMAESVNRSADKEAGKRANQASADEIAQAHVEAAAMIKKSSDDRITAAQNEKDAADAAFRAAVETAKKAREAADASDPTFTKAKAAEATAGAAAGLKSVRESTSSGTFSTARLGGMFGGSEIKRTAQATEDTAKEVKRLADIAQRRGLVWA